MSTEGPRRFFVARHLVVVGWILSAVCLILGAVELTLWLADRNTQRVVAIAIALLVPAFFGWAMRKPVAELHADHARLPRGWPGALVRVPYHDIVGLAKVPQVWFTVTYQTSRGRRHAYMQPERIDRFDEMEAILREKTRLEVSVHNPVWARPMRVVLRAFPREEWQSYVLAPLFMLIAMGAGFLTLFGFAALCRYWGWRAPFWLMVALPTLVILALFGGLVWNHARRRGRPHSASPS